MTNHCKLTAANMESEHKYYNHMKKCCFIIPYFGHFNNYFQLFLKSCSYNEDFNWLIITDDKTKYDYPKNVKVIYQSFEETVSFVQSKSDYPCNIVRPYKFCDLKPMYGYIFEDYIKDFEFWGYCDCDIILGKLSKFITNEMLKTYDKLFCLGHMTLMKNSKDNNRLFMKSINGQIYYKKVLGTEQLCVFDEVGIDEFNINQIFLSAGKTVLEKDISYNINIRYPYFLRTIFVGLNVPNNGHGFVNEKHKTSICIWNQGKLYRIIKNNDKSLTEEEFAYIHLQRRKMTVGNILKNNKYKILANAFLPLEVETITRNNFDKIRKRILCNQFFKIVIIPGLKKIVYKFLCIKNANSPSRFPR